MNIVSTRFEMMLALVNKVSLRFESVGLLQNTDYRRTMKN